MVVKQSLSYHSVVDPENLDGKSLHRDNFKSIMSFEIAKATENGIVCIDNDGRSAVFDFFNRKEEKIPDFESVLKKAPAVKVDAIGITPKYLERISKAMHSPSGIFRMRFHGIDKPITIDVPEIEDQIAILMPALLSENLFS
jgi:hypothetical protein